MFKKKKGVKNVEVPEVCVGKICELVPLSSEIKGLGVPVDLQNHALMQAQAFLWDILFLKPKRRYT
jgi:hypothetical protein